MKQNLDPLGYDDTNLPSCMTLDIHPFNKSRRHFECLINDVIRGELSAAILNDLITPHRTMSTEETKKGQSQLLYPVPIVLIR